MIYLKKSGQLSLRINLMRLLSIEVFEYVRGINPSYLNMLQTCRLVAKV